ncbi:hypothetical protein ACIRD2_14530 [Streptomyces sp. NPDC093595]|uniref:hypothetical protein n=1 Tax=Streptomyces sp. NPDC093595 TaxID=3366045 RepID=UPI00380C53E7
MSEAGQSWRRAFKALPQEAAHVRSWTALRTHHADAPLVAHELFVAILGTRPAVIEMAIATADSRVRISAAGPARLSVRHSHGPGWAIVAGLCRHRGVTPDERGLWAQLQQQDET